MEYAKPSIRILSSIQNEKGCIWGHTNANSCWPIGELH